MLCGLPTLGMNAASLLRGKPADDRPCQTLLGSWRSQGNCLSGQRWRSRSTLIFQGRRRPTPSWRGPGEVRGNKVEKQEHTHLLGTLQTQPFLEARDRCITLGGAPAYITTLLILVVCVESLLCLLSSWSVQMA